MYDEDNITEEVDYSTEFYQNLDVDLIMQMESSANEYSSMYCDDDRFRFYGEYGGRGYHRGIALAASDDWSIFLFILHLFEDEGSSQKLKEILKQDPHVDNLGRGVVYSWSADYFEV